MSEREIRQRSADLSRTRFEAEMPRWLQRILMARDILADEDISADLSSLLAPNSMFDMDRASQLLADHLTQARSILIVGDYDADGATSCALMVSILRAMGASHVDFLVPNRFDYGYGLTPEIVAVAAHRNPDLIVTVDNGIASVEGVKAAKDQGIKVLITDHHLPGPQLPAAEAIVNPNQPGCDFPSKYLAGVGVAFYLLSAVRARLRVSGWFKERHINEPRLANWLDLVALGTVADLVPLDKNNRVLVQNGLQLVRSGKGNVGIRALFEVAGRDWRKASSGDLGFAVGPRINAAGRLDDISLGIQCLLAEDEYEARKLAQQLHEINRDRRAIEQRMHEEAESLIGALADSDENTPWGVTLFHPSWHHGVVGLLASRAKEQLHRPVIAFARESEGQLKGSGRSIPGFHMRDALHATATANPGLISRFGGHAMAAGLSLEEEDLEAFTRAFDQTARKFLKKEDLQQIILTDGELPVDAFTLETARKLRDILPWGQQCPEPQFEGEFEVIDTKVVGDRHVRFDLRTAERQFVSAIWFNADFDALNLNNFNKGESKIQLVYRLGINDYRGETLQLQIVALA